MYVVLIRCNNIMLCCGRKSYREVYRVALRERVRRVPVNVVKVAAAAGVHEKLIYLKYYCVVKNVRIFFR